ncbi:xanthosine/proton symporter XapB [Silvimonas sp. JCM 19000]
MKNRLKVLSFLQYFIWGAWVVTFGAYMIRTLGFTGMQVGEVYSTKGLAAIIMPGLLGIVADKWVPANRLYALCHTISGLALFYAAQVQQPSVMFWVMLINMMMFMPTMALSNTITYFCLGKAGLDTVANFPRIRVFGTAGFIVAMWAISLLHFELSNVQLYIAGGASLLLAAYALTLPTVPTAERGANQSLASRFGLDAFVLFKRPQMALFFLFAMLLGVVLQVTNTFGNPFLHDFANQPQYADSVVVQYPSMLLSMSQISEIFFIMAIPYMLRRFGIKTVMVVSMLAWALRFGFFAIGNPSPLGMVWLLLSMVVYGCAFDFFNISGSIYIEKEVSPTIRASAQGLFMTIVNGLGAFVGARASGAIVDHYTVSGVRDWHSIWLIFAGYALLLAIVFALGFKYKHVPEHMVQVQH